MKEDSDGILNSRRGLFKGKEGNSRKVAGRGGRRTDDSIHRKMPQENTPLCMLPLKINLKTNRDSSSNIPHQVLLKGTGTTPPCSPRETDRQTYSQAS